MKSLTVKSGLMTVLSRLEGREFTVDDLTETYIKDPLSLHQSKKAARQFVYRNMLRLIDSGDLTRVVVDGGWPDIVAVISDALTITADLVAKYHLAFPDMDFLCGYRKECVW